MMRILERSIPILPEIDAHTKTRRKTREREGDPIRNRIHARIVESHPVEESFPRRITKKPRSRVSRLRTGCDRTDLSESKTQVGK
jgi:hypothetical protein